MEQIISQITASQGLSAVAVIALFAILWLIISAFAINDANSEIKSLRSQVNNYMNANTNRFDLLSASHKEINNKYSDAIARGHKTRQDFNERFQNNEQRFQEFAKAVNELCRIKIQATKPTTPTSSKNQFDEYAQKLNESKINKTEYIPTSNKRPKFKLGDKVKTNTGNFVGKVVDRVKDNGKFVYVVENKKESKYYSESTLRHA